VTGADLWDFCRHLATLSLFSIGGANVVLPDIYRYVVVERAWITATQFSSLVALAQAAPGPNVLVVGIIGFQIGGLLVAAVAFASFVVPTSLLTFTVAHYSEALRRAPWARIAQRGLGPLTAGLVVANGFILTSASGAGRASYPLALACAVIALRLRVNPVWIILGSGVVGGIFLS
jgi:chromate transporter